MPIKVKQEITNLLKPYQWLIPGWCQRVHIMYNPLGNEEGVLLTCVNRYDYREVIITFFPLFFTNREDKDEDLLHELLHVFVSVITDYAKDCLNRLVPADEAPKFRETLFEELRIREESFVQDLAHCLAARLT